MPAQKNDIYICANIRGQATRVTDTGDAMTFVALEYIRYTDRVTGKRGSLDVESKDRPALTIHGTAECESIRTLLAWVDAAD